MALRSEKDVILEHALRDEENLEIALKISAAYPDLCSLVIADFVKSIETKLASQLGSRWKVWVGDVSTFAWQYAKFLKAAFLPDPGQFTVELSGDETGYPKKVFLAVHSASASVRREPIKAIIDDLYATGKPTDYSLWYRYIDKAYSNWGSEDSTLLLYRKGEAVDYFVGHLERLARAVEKALLPDLTAPPNT